MTIKVKFYVFSENDHIFEIVKAQFEISGTLRNIDISIKINFNKMLYFEVNIV